jgi:hypothetical protein
VDQPPPPLQHRLLALTEGDWSDVRAWCPHLGELQSGPMSPIRWRTVLVLSDRHPAFSPSPLPRRS